MSNLAGTRITTLTWTLLRERGRENRCRESTVIHSPTTSTQLKKQLAPATPATPAMMMTEPIAMLLHTSDRDTGDSVRLHRRKI